MFTLNGPATGSADMPVTDATISSWVSSSGDVLTQTNTDPLNVDYDGRYSGNHINGNSIETFELLICHIKAPANKYATGLTEPFTVS